MNRVECTVLDRIIVKDTIMQQLNEYDITISNISLK